MGITIDDPRAHELANELAALTGESLDEAVTKAIGERLEREREQRRLIDDLKTIARDYHRFAGRGAVRTIGGSTMSAACRSDRPRHVRCSVHPA